MSCLLQILSNGGIGFEQNSRNYKSNILKTGPAMIAPLWNRNDLRKGGQIFYREVTGGLEKLLGLSFAEHRTVFVFEMVDQLKELKAKFVISTIKTLNLYQFCSSHGPTCNRTVNRQ